MVVISTMEKHYGIRQKNLGWLKEIVFGTYILIFSLKKYQFIPQNEKLNYLKEINDIYAEKIQYQKFLKYFKKCQYIFLKFW